MKRTRKIRTEKKAKTAPHVRGVISYKRQPIEIESPEQMGYENIRYNLTESSVPDVLWSELDLDFQDMVLGYGHHDGIPSLRQRIASEGEGLKPENVLMTAGSAAALFIVTTSLLKPGDHLIVLHPNYVTNIETPRAIGCRLDLQRLSFDNNYSLDIGHLERLIQPHTRLISLTYPHNPTGAMITEAELRAIVVLAESKGCYLLLDETYRDMVFGPPLPVAASLSERTISVSSFSKSFGMPGIRVGWLVTQNQELMETFLAAKEQIFICNSVLDEKVADYFLSHKGKLFCPIQVHIQANFRVLKTWIENAKYFEWVEPRGGCVAFPRIKPDKGIDVDLFYKILNTKYKTFVGPGHWFEMDRRYMRIGYGWPSRRDLQKGLSCLAKAAEESVQA